MSTQNEKELSTESSFSCHQFRQDRCTFGTKGHENGTEEGSLLLSRRLVFLDDHAETFLPAIRVNNAIEVFVGAF